MGTSLPLLPFPKWKQDQMDRLKTLRKSVTEMSLEELREHVRQIRIQRRIVKDKPATKAKKVRASNASKDKASKMLAKMTPEQIAALMKELGEDGGTEV